MPRAPRDRDLIIPDQAMARAAQQLLHDLRPDGSPFALINGSTGDAYDLPEAISRMLFDALALLARNNAVALSCVEMEMTTNQTADILNVSRTFVISLLEKGEIPYRIVGTHRRVRLEDALTYRDKMKAKADEAIARIAETDQGLGLDD